MILVFVILILMSGLLLLNSDVLKNLRLFKTNLDRSHNARIVLGPAYLPAAQQSVRKPPQWLLESGLSQKAFQDLNERTADILIAVNEMLSGYEPDLVKIRRESAVRRQRGRSPKVSVSISKERRMTLAALDALFLDPLVTKRPSVQLFYRHRMETAFKDAFGEPEENGGDESLKIWKLYGDGFIIKSPTVTMAFDLVRGHCVGEEGFLVPMDQIKDAANRCDVLFISHDSPDHVESEVVEAFLDVGALVVAPIEVLADSPDLHSRITHLAPDPKVLQIVHVGEEQKKLEIMVGEGKHGDVLSHVIWIKTPEDQIVVHAGDLTGMTDLSWIRPLREKQKVTLLAVNGKTQSLEQLVRVTEPMFFLITGENELSRDPMDRLSYGRVFDRISRCHSPALMMTWGEGFSYTKPEPVNRSARGPYRKGHSATKTTSSRSGDSAKHIRGPTGEEYFREQVDYIRKQRDRIIESSNLERSIMNEDNAESFRSLGIDWINDQKYSVIFLTIDGCSPCEDIKPYYELLKKKYSPDVRFAEINLKKTPEARQLLRIPKEMGVPNILFYEHGNGLAAAVGYGKSSFGITCDQYLETFLLGAFPEIDRKTKN